MSILSIHSDSEAHAELEGVAFARRRRLIGVFVLLAGSVVNGPS